MSPLDRELSVALHARAEALPVAGDPLPGVHRRVRVLRRRRRAAAAAGACAVAGLVALGGSLVTGGADPDVLLPATPPPASQPPDQPPDAAVRPSSPAAPHDAPQAQLTWEEPWALRGDAALAEELTDPALAAFAAAEGARPSDVRGEALFATTVPDVGTRALVLLARVGDEQPQLVVHAAPAAGGPYVDARPLEQGTLVVTRVLPGDEVPYVVALASPASGQVDYLPDGRDPALPVEGGPGWGLFERRVGPDVVDRVRVWDGDGRVVVEEPLQLGCAEGPCDGEGAG